MDDQLHAAGFVKEAFQHDLFLRRNDPKCFVSRDEIVRQLTRANFGDSGRGHERVSNGSLCAMVTRGICLLCDPIAFLVGRCAV